MKIVIIGNGILGLTAGYRLLQKDPGTTIALIGPAGRKGCASLAAAAMLNAFCEVDATTLGNEKERQKFLFNKAATPYWPSFLKQIEKDSSLPLEYGFGTFLINNHATDSLEDESFEAIVGALDQFKEPYEKADPSAISHYKPSAAGRAARAIFIPGEGWVNPILLLSALQKILRESGRVELIDGSCRSIERASDRISHVTLETGEKVAGDAYLLAPGAVFSKIMRDSKIDLAMPRVFYGVGCSILIKTDEATLKNCVRTPNRGLSCGVYCAPQGGGHTLIGASNLISPEPEDNVRVASVHSLLKSAMEQINSDYYRSQLVRINVGWRPTSEDTFPMIGKTSLRNLVVATGTKRDGLHCSPLISELLADLLLAGSSKLEMPLFSPERKPLRVFSREEAIRISVRQAINAAYQHGFVPPKNRMLEDLEKYYTADLNELHDRVSAHDWGIPAEMINMYRYGHIK